MEVRPGYKQTELGAIPADWVIMSLGEVATIRDGTHQTPNYVAFGIPFFSVEHVTSGNFGDTKFISEQEHRFLTRTSKIEKGDILMTRIGSIGDCKLIDWDVEASYYVSLALLKIRAGFSAAYIAHYSKSASFQKEIELHSLQSAIPKKINLGPISDVKVAIPPRVEQDAIASVLGDVNALVAGLDRLIAKKRDLKQAAMQQLLTGQTRLPGFQGEWKVKPFTGVLSRVNAKAHQIQTIDYQATGRYPVVDQGKKAIVGFSDKGEQRFLCPRGGVIVFGDHTCIVKFIEFDFLVGADGTQLLVGKDGQCTRFHALQLQYQGVEPTGYNRHFKFLKEREFAAPQVQEQSAIAAVLADMDAELTALEARRDKTRALKQAMMQELLTGRTRLV